jgi:hypothetical protein
MSGQIPMVLQGELIIKTGVVQKVNASNRKGKDGPIGCVYVTLLAMGSAPIECKADLTKYGSNEPNALGQQFAALQEGQSVAITGRMKSGTKDNKAYSFFEPEHCITDENVFPYLAIAMGVNPVPARK